MTAREERRRNRIARRKRDYYETVEEIPDLSIDMRADKFWQMTMRLVFGAMYTRHLVSPPMTGVGCLRRGETIRVWKWVRRFADGEMFKPPANDEIMMKQENGWPVNGTHRAAALWCLGRPVPGFLVKDKTHGV
jgi:hypothetical protein